MDPTGRTNTNNSSKFKAWINNTSPADATYKAIDITSYALCNCMYYYDTFIFYERVIVTQCCSFASYNMYPDSKNEGACYDQQLRQMLMYMVVAQKRQKRQKRENLEYKLDELEVCCRLQMQWHTIYVQVTINSELWTLNSELSTLNSQLSTLNCLFSWLSRLSRLLQWRGIWRDTTPPCVSKETLPKAAGW